LDTDESGFLSELDASMQPVATSHAGIFVAGACVGPKDIAETVTQASAAAAKVLSTFAQWNKVAERGVAARVEGS
jgi:heterodisulfide reductase subunit A